ncbi:MAG: MarR family transcriptional regulator, partial [Pseudomonadota bacterium]
LHDAGLCSVREIARDADMEKSRVSRAVARLEGRGLIARAADGTDKRLLALKLTASGSAMVEKILPHASDYAEALFARLDDPKAFRDGLAQLLAASAIEK